jgi:hypothetical protein
LRDGSAVPKNGAWLKYEGELRMCRSGLHFSKHPFDALQYAPGNILCKVEVRGDIQYKDDKGVCRERRIIARFDATDMLRKFARLCALDVIDKWDAPEIVVRYLKTGDESIRTAAWSAAWGAARAAAWGAARAARAARDAASDDAWSAARDAAWDATWAAARAARAARDAARDAAWDAAWDATWAAQKKRFARMVNAEFRK